MQLDRNIVGTASEYFARVKECDIEELNEFVDYEETGDKKFEISWAQFEEMEDIIACQVSFWCLRRLSYSCQSNCDSMRRILNKKVQDYEKKYGKFHDYNEENIW